ncbi:hypothetical protein AG1IA_05921 [Rhizoctonia solani AG-1 IA]|uniref:Uncharacterized protein n=1 Tax=Thanatephorus cucumeris (strain AG1-IA) TaxID=983506 RepID=L8WPG9_THACA|nr:hypothetical protein AG1IA_05921 [Rhizoctonia solani AG-1 IA]
MEVGGISGSNELHIQKRLGTKEYDRSEWPKVDIQCSRQLVAQKRRGPWAIPQHSLWSIARRKFKRGPKETPTN